MNVSMETMLSMKKYSLVDEFTPLLLFHFMDRRIYHVIHS